MSKENDSARLVLGEKPRRDKQSFFLLLIGFGSKLVTMHALLPTFLFSCVFAHAAAADEYPVKLCVGQMRGSEAKSKAFCQRQEKLNKKVSVPECLKEEARKQGEDYGLLRVNGNHVLGPDIAVGLKRAKYTFQTRGQSVVVDFSKRKASEFCASYTRRGVLALDPCQCRLPISENF